MCFFLLHLFGRSTRKRIGVFECRRVRVEAIWERSCSEGEEERKLKRFWEARSSFSYVRRRFALMILTAVGRQVRGLSSISRVCVLWLGDLAVCTVFSFCCSDSLPLSVCSLSLRGIYDDYRPGIKRFKEGSRSLDLVYREGQWSSLEHTPVHGVHRV